MRGSVGEDREDEGFELAKLILVFFVTCLKCEKIIVGVLEELSEHVHKLCLGLSEYVELVQELFILGSEILDLILSWCR